MTKIAMQRRAARGLLAAALGLALIATGPLRAEEASALAEAEAAMQRLDFRVALAGLKAAIDARPNDPAAYIARAELHRQMHRPALAFADLARALEADPGNPAALKARAQLWLEAGRFADALAAFNAALEAAPDDPVALAGRARANAGAGFFRDALADIDRARASASDDAALTTLQSEILAAQNAREAASVVYDPAALMGPAFRVVQGAATAENELVFLHAGNALDRDSAGLDTEALARAIDTGALRVLNLFTYTGQDSAIWANLALICGGPAGLDPLRAGLTGAAGQSALAAIDAQGDTAPLKAVVAAAYAEAGIDATKVETCAFDRGQALDYLAGWNQKSNAMSWKGVNFYDSWPVLVLNGTVVTAQTLSARLAEIAPQADASEPQVAVTTAPAPVPDTAPAASPADGADPANAVPESDDVPAAAAPPEAVAEAAPNLPAAAEITANPAPATPEPDLADASMPPDGPPDSGAAPDAAGEDDAAASATTPALQSSLPPSAGAPRPDPEPGAEEPVIAAAVAAAPLSDLPPRGIRQPEPVSADDDAPVRPDAAAENAIGVPPANPASAVDATADDATPQVTITDATPQPDGDAETMPDASESATIPPKPRPTAPEAQIAAVRPEPRPERLSETPEPVVAPAPEVAATPTPEVAEAPASANLRLPAELKGIWTPTLAACLGYLDRIEEATGFDAALPALNPLDGPPIGTVLLTSQHLYLYNLVGTECALTGLPGGGADGEPEGAADAPWQARLSCSNALAPGVTTTLRVTRLPADGPAPRLAMAFGAAAPVDMVQCRPLGALGKAFAGLWQVDPDTCRATAPVSDAAFGFSPGPEGELELVLRPETPPTGAETARLQVSVDGVALAQGVPHWADGAWTLSLGPIAKAVEPLSRGLLLEARIVGGGEPFTRVLPLFGSGQAMAQLTACAPTAD